MTEKPLCTSRRRAGITCPRCGRRFKGHSVGSQTWKCPVTTEELFWARVDRSAGPDECWPWLGYRQPDGYGQYRVGDKTRNTHSYAYELTYGPIPDGLETMHSCHVNYCTNPAHMKLGTHAENMAESYAARKHAHGERNNHAKLTEAIVRQIRQEYTGARGEQSVIAKRYGLNNATISALLSGRSWRFVQ